MKHLKPLLASLLLLLCMAMPAWAAGNEPGNEPGSQPKDESAMTDPVATLDWDLSGNGTSVELLLKNLNHRDEQNDKDEQTGEQNQQSDPIYGVQLDLYFPQDSALGNSGFTPDASEAYSSMKVQETVMNDATYQDMIICVLSMNPLNQVTGKLDQLDLGTLTLPSDPKTLVPTSARLILLGKNSTVLNETKQFVMINTPEGESTVTHTVTFQDEAGNAIGEPVQVKNGETVPSGSFPAAPEKSGYDFLGWVIEQPDTDKGKTFNEQTQVFSNLTVRPEYRQHQTPPSYTWTVRFVDEDGNELASPRTVADHGTLGSLPEAPAREGFTFLGWFLSGSDTPFTASTPVTGDITLVARYEETPAETWTVEFLDEEGNTLAPSRSVENGKAIGELPVPDPRPGQAFLGWFLADGTKVTDGTIVTGNMTLTARFAREWTVTFKDGHTGETLGQHYVQNGEAIGSHFPETHTHHGFQFQGWFLEDGTEATEETIITSDTVVTARYSPVQWTVTFEDSLTGETIGEPVQVANGEAIGSLPEAPVHQGYTFREWQDTEGFVITAETQVTHDLTVRAIYDEVDHPTEHYTVRFLVDGTVVATKDIASGAPLGTLPEEPEKPGYRFDGWVDASGNPVSETTIVTGAMDITAKFTPLETFTVTFEADGTITDTRTVLAGEAVGTLPEAPQKEGYRFVGWYDGTTPFTADTVITENVTVVARYEKIDTPKPETFIVTFVADDKVVDTRTVAAGESVGTLPAAPTKEGWHFVGWYVDSTPFTASTPVTSDLTVVARYEKAGQTFIVTFLADDQVVDTRTVAAGESVGTLPAAPAKAGWHFVGWYAGSSLFTASTPVTSDLTVVARYERTGETCTVTFLVDGRFYASVEVEKGGTVSSMPANPVKPGYRFNGWFVGGQRFTSRTIVNSDLTAIASFSYWGGGSSDDGGSGGGGGGGSSDNGGSGENSPSKPSNGTTVTNPNGSTTTTTQNPDGSTTTKTEYKDGTVDELVERKDGSSTRTLTTPDGTETVTETAKDGSSRTTTTMPDGLTATSEADPSGHMTKGELTIPKSVSDRHDTVTAPLEVEPERDSADAPEITIHPEDRNADITVEIPVTRTGKGIVAVLVDENGHEQVVRDCVVTEDGVLLDIQGNVTLKILDRSGNFRDVPAGYWGADAVDFVFARELFTGTDANTFSPDMDMSRGMLVTVLYRLAYEPEAGIPAFPDVATDTWYSDAVAWAASSGVITGYGDGSFGPDDPITREQMATIFYRYAQINGLVRGPVTGDLSRYADGDDVGEYAREAVRWAVSVGLMNGTDATHLSPVKSASRAEVAAIVMRFAENVLH